MAFTNNQFKGYIDGKAIWDYGRNFDYENKDLDYRIDVVKKSLNINEQGTSDDMFWQDVWDSGICKTGLNTDDDLWSDTNVCRSLQTYANYLLEAYKPTEDREKIKVYTDKGLFERALNEEEYLLGMASSNNDHLKVFVDANKNHKLAKDIEVDEVDIEKYPEVRVYDDLKNYMLDLHKNPKKRNKLARKKGMRSRDIYSILNRNRKLLEEDKLDFKLSKERPIVWKSPLKDSGNEIDWSYLDMFDPVHVKALLQVRRDMDCSDEVYIDMELLLDNVDISDIQKEILHLWRKGLTLEEISKRLNVVKSTASRHLDKIVKKVIDSYEKEYEDKHYYMNVCKGKYKTCSKCGEVKLLQRFDKNGKRGYMSMCKSCR